MGGMGAFEGNEGVAPPVEKAWLDPEGQAPAWPEMHPREIGNPESA